MAVLHWHGTTPCENVHCTRTHDAVEHEGNPPTRAERQEAAGNSGHKLGSYEVAEGMKLYNPARPEQTVEVLSPIYDRNQTDGWWILRDGRSQRERSHTRWLVAHYYPVDRKPDHE